MAGFCGSCGAPVRGPFCGKCGQPVDAPQVLAQPIAAASAGPLPQAVGAVPPATKSGGLGTIILVVVLVFAVVAVLGIGAALYGLYWAKKKVDTYSAAVSGGGNGQQVAVAHGNSCALLSTAELQKVLGVTIERSEEIEEENQPGCAYFTNTAGFATLRNMAVEQAKRDSARAQKRPAAKTDNPLELLKDTKDLEGAVKALSMQLPGKDNQVFSFTVDRNAASGSWTGMKATMSVVPGFEEVSGVGDHAMIGTFGHAFYAAKGNTIIYLNTLYVPDASSRGAEIARRILGRM
ncbi:MAG: zinc ribbon domain-containing protein [Candidatus Acidiferrum sp.]